MKVNPLIDQAASDRHGDCCKNQYCMACGAHVSGYNANASLIAMRPEAEKEGWDWWVACDNADCAHAYGEGVFQSNPDWIKVEERVA
jgi:hypothetical protein